MELFKFKDFTENILPRDGILFYEKKFLLKESASAYFKVFSNEIKWQQDRIKLFGKEHLTKRKVAWYGQEGLRYTYSGNTKFALPWHTDLLEIKNSIEKIIETKFNSCLLNLYHNGAEGMSWHSDNEKELGPNPVIASISLGAERKFAFKHKVTKEKYTITLNHGSLLIMKGPMQNYWLHSIPKTRSVNLPRINLTFRNIIL